METKFWDIIEECKEKIEESKMEVEEVPFIAHQHIPMKSHMHTSIDY